MEYTCTVSRPRTISDNAKTTRYLRNQSRTALFIYLSRIIAQRGMEESLMLPTIQLLREEDIKIPDFIDKYNEDSSQEQKEKVMEYLPELFYEYFEGKTLEDGILSRCSEITRTWPLLETDIKVLSLLYTMTCRKKEGKVLGHWLSEGDETWNPSRAAVCLGLTTEEVKKALSDDGPLINLGIIYLTETDSEQWGLSKSVLTILNEPDNIEARELPLINAKRMTESSHTLDDFSIPIHEQAFYRKALSDNEQKIIVLHGNSELFRKQFMEALGSHSEKQACQYCYSDNLFEISGETPNILTKTTNITAACGYPLFVEKGDVYINEYNSLFFSSLKGTVVFMVDEIDKGSRKEWNSRAFCRDLSDLKNKKYLDRDLRIESLIIDFHMEDQISSESIKKLQDRYSCTGENFKIAVQTTAFIMKELPEEDAESILDFQLASRENESASPSTETGNLKPLTARYDPAILNTGQPLQPLENALKKFKSGKVSHALNVLFWGKPGTGKTEYVKYLAQRHGLPLHIHRASDIIDRGVGDTEKNIAGIFKKANKTPSILFIDEADSLLRSRSLAKNSWEVTQVNELLTWMENFSGILICCTNLMEDMDPAVMRRFIWKIEFRAPNAQSRLKLYRSFFPQAADTMNDIQARRITAMKELTPGDLHAVQTRLTYTDEKLTHSRILDALEQDYELKSVKKARPVGFSA